MVNSGQAVQSTKHFNIEEIADGIYAAIAKDGTGAMANVGFVDLGESILVFDSFNTQQAADELHAAIPTLTGKSVSHLINSHWHGDHIRGNQVFHDVSIVATEQTKAIMQELHPARIERQRSGLEELGQYIEKLKADRDSTNDANQRIDLSNQISLLEEIKLSLPALELTLPNETFTSDWCFEGTDRTVECRTFGGGHTASDSFLYIPDARVCFIGDLVAVNNHMMVADGDIHSWISILNKLNRYDIEYVVPGHGPVGGKEWIERASEYLNKLLEISDMVREQAMSDEEIYSLEVPEAYRTWSARDVYLRNIRHLARQE